MKKGNEARPEPVLFLLEALDAMEADRKKRGAYAKEWHLLDITFAKGPYRLGEPGVQPTSKDQKRWRPKGCRFTYEIVSADKDGFLVQAMDDDNVAAYEIRAGMKAPRRPRAARDEALCTIERPRGKALPEPAMFLNAASAKFAEYRGTHGRYPSSWEDLDFHWALTPHKAGDKKVRPPSGCGETWKPLGARYSYKIVRAEKDYFRIRSINDRGLDDYRISAGDVSPVPIRR